MTSHDNFIFAALSTRQNGGKEILSSCVSLICHQNDNFWRNILTVTCQAYFATIPCPKCWIISSRETFPAFSKQPLKERKVEPTSVLQHPSSKITEMKRSFLRVSRRLCVIAVLFGHLEWQPLSLDQHCSSLAV